MDNPEHNAAELLMQEKWDEIEQMIHDTRPTAIAFDGCHKIYVIADDEEFHKGCWQE